jgi:mannose-6-phosphate isomerase-like protein (cupin superfamily)
MMFRRSKAEAARRELPGLESYLLLGRGDVADDNLTVTWVDVQPGAAQQPHSHAPEQVYVIARGSGVMHVNDDAQPVTVGDAVYIPPNATHYIENTGQEVLAYISAATPSFESEPIYESGQEMES